MAKPTLKSGEGWEIPCQPLLNSSINFVMGVVTSRDQRIQNKATDGKSPICGPPEPDSSLEPVILHRTSACVVPVDGEYRREFAEHRKRVTRWDGWTERAR